MGWLRWLARQDLPINDQPDARLRTTATVWIVERCLSVHGRHLIWQPELWLFRSSRPEHWSLAFSAIPGARFSTAAIGSTGLCRVPEAAFRLLCSRRSNGH